MFFFKIILLILFTVTPILARPQVGVVLCGGGAKGFAHIGALRVMEEANIPIDMICGTSIGSIMGGFYACGYRAEDLAEFSQSQDWRHLFSNPVPRRVIPVYEKKIMNRYVVSFPLEERDVKLPSGLIQGQNVINLFCDRLARFHTTENFRNLPIPFFCVATDLETGEEVRLDSGFLPEAILASMAVPGVFAPVYINDRVLIDGGVVNNLPSDHMKAFGADIIIAIDIDRNLKSRGELNSIDNILQQLITFQDYETTQRNRELCDLIIEPDISGYQATDFSQQAVDSLIVLGERAARQQWDALIDLKKEYGLPDANLPPRPDSLPPVKLTGLRVKSQNHTQPAFVRNRFDIEFPDTLSIADIHAGVDRVYGTLNFDRVFYELASDEPTELILHVQEKSTRTLNVGFHSDSYKSAAVLLNATIRESYTGVSRFIADVELSSEPGLAASYIFGLKHRPLVGVAGRLKDMQVDVFDAGDKVLTWDVVYGVADASLFTLIRNGFQFGFRAQVEHYRGSSLKASELDWDVPESIRSTLINYSVFAELDNFNQKYFPTKGASVRAEYQATTDNGWQFENQGPLHSAWLRSHMAQQVMPRLVWLPGVSARLVLTQAPPLILGNFIGGPRRATFFDEHLPFWGAERLTPVDRLLFTAHSDVRLRVWEQTYATLLLNAGYHSPSWTRFTSGQWLWGAGLQLSYNSVLGPVSATFAIGNLTDSVQRFLALGYWF